MGGWQLEAPRQPAPEGFVWANAAQLQAEYTLPGAFKVYRKQMLALEEESE